MNEETKQAIAELGEIGIKLEYFFELPSRHSYPCGEYMLCTCYSDDHTSQVWSQAVATVAAYARIVMVSAPIDGDDEAF